MKKYELPAGEYWIIDPCYVIPDEDWGDLLRATGLLGTYDLDKLYLTPRPKNEQYGSFKWKGHTLASSTTMYGDGGYSDSDGYDYSVDAGCIGAVPVALCEKDRYTDFSMLGRKVTFDKPFEFWYEDGRIHVGHIVIDTADDFGDDCDDDNW
jgi:hypothetical protein